MCFSSLVLSRWPNIFLKNVPKPSKIPSLLSAHAGIYIYVMSESCYENNLGETVKKIVFLRRAILSLWASFLEVTKGVKTVPTK